MRVLVADDDGVTRHMVESSLKQWGYGVTSAESGEEAWEEFQKRPAEILIVDWMMPGEIDGLELARRVRSAELDFYPYLILLTSRDSKESLLEGLEAGVDDYLTKPLDPPELKARLKIARRINRLEEKLQEKMRELSNKNRRITEDLQEAARIQRGLLPEHGRLPSSVDFAHKFQPSQQLGGDLFNLIQLDEQHIAFYLLDVSGHGLPASLHSVAINYFLSSKVTELGIFKTHLEPEPHYRINEPTEVVNRLRENIDPITRTGTYFTMALAILNLNRPSVSLLPAGCTPVLLAKADGSVEELTGPSAPIGLYEEAEYETVELDLNPGDYLVMYSDGLLEAVEESCHAVSPDRLKQLLRSEGGLNAEDLRQRILAGADLQSDLTDDVSLLIAGPTGDRKAHPSG